MRILCVYMLTLPNYYEVWYNYERFHLFEITRPHRLTARTVGSHPTNRSSILRGVMVDRNENDLCNNTQVVFISNTQSAFWSGKS